MPWSAETKVAELDLAQGPWTSEGIETLSPWGTGVL
jgi:hypothetical protein